MSSRRLQRILRAEASGNLYLHRERDMPKLPKRPDGVHDMLYPRDPSTGRFTTHDIKKRWRGKKMILTPGQFKSPKKVQRTFKEPAPVREPKLYAFCVAATYSHAITTMEIDWRWEKVGKDKHDLPVFLSPAGLKVSPLADFTHLQKYPAERTFVYLGHGFAYAPGGPDFFAYERHKLTILRHTDTELPRADVQPR